MATSAYSSAKQYSPMTQVVAHASLKMAQASAMILPPVYIVTRVFLRRGTTPMSIARIMHFSTISTVAGAGAGAAAGYLRLMNEPQVALEDRVFRLRHNVGQVRTDDYSMIGATLGAILIPAIFLKRAPFLSLVAGGGSLGLGAGTATHIFKTMSEGQKVKPEGMVGEIPVIGGNETKK